MAIAPPLTLTLAGSQPRSRLTDSACAANASLASIRSRSLIVQPARSSALREAGIGPVPMMAASTPIVANEAIRASGVRPRRAASSSRISTTAAAPSFRPDALPAVTVPSFLKAGLRPARTSSVVARGFSSVSTMMSPLRVLIVTGTISALNRPSAIAAAAFVCEASANASCSSRVSAYLAATFSAVMPM
ncbi:hypothetical protein D3C73_879470 [compost metagenome]